MKNFGMFLTSSMLTLCFVGVFCPPIIHSQSIPSEPVPTLPPIPSVRSKLTDPIAKGYFDLAKAFFYALDWDAAIENFRKALERDPDFGNAYYYLGKALFYKKSYIDAEENTRKALNYQELSVSTADVHELLGTINAYQNNLDKAETEYKTALESDSYHSESLNNLAYTYALQEKNLDEALSLVNQALQLISEEDPRRAYYLDTRSWVYYKRGNYKDAEKDALDSILIGKKFSTSDAAYSDFLLDHHYHLGEIYLQKGESQLAKREFQKVLEIDSSYRSALESLRKIP
jgi:tetratricopeptide (TPR) repeat protein